MVNSIMSLMEKGLEDGEEAGKFDSAYVDVSCVVTSDTDGMTFAAGERACPNTAPMQRFFRQASPSVVNSIPLAGKCAAPVCRVRGRCTVAHLEYTPYQY